MTASVQRRHVVVALAVAITFAAAVALFAVVVGGTHENDDPIALTGSLRDAAGKPVGAAEVRIFTLDGAPADGPVDVLASTTRVPTAGSRRCSLRRTAVCRLWRQRTAAS